MALYSIEVYVPDELVGAFEDAMTGGDSDITLAAEYAMNYRLYEEVTGYCPSWMKIELDTPERVG